MSIQIRCTTRNIQALKFMFGFGQPHTVMVTGDIDTDLVHSVSYFDDEVGRQEYRIGSDNVVDEWIRRQLNIKDEREMLCPFTR